MNFATSMTVTFLKKLAEELQVKLPSPARQIDIVQALIDSNGGFSAAEKESVMSIMRQALEKRLEKRKKKSDKAGDDASPKKGDDEDRTGEGDKPTISSHMYVYKHTVGTPILSLAQLDSFT